MKENTQAPKADTHPTHGHSASAAPFDIRTVKRALADQFVAVLSVGEDRKEDVRKNIVEGSSPNASYYILLAISSLIAGFGLVTDSPAVVIGAMLISPLMTPIFGISIGMVQGNVSLIRRSLVVEFGGVALVVLVAVLLGLLPLEFAVTREMLARTHPTLLDLGVATLAGVAGCMAMIDERMSPVLPGIAMATSLTPPLATSGLCIALGAFHGAWGAFLLFFANFLAILVVSATLFIVAGFVSKQEMGSGLTVLRRFASAAVGLLIVTVLLTRALLGIIEKLQTTDTIRSVLNQELSVEPATSVEKFIFKRRRDSVDILASVRTPRVLRPTQIAEIEKKLTNRLHVNTRLIARCNLAKDVSSTGSTSAVVDEDLNGEFITEDLNPRVRRIQCAEQALREILEHHPSLYLRELDLIELDQGPVILTTIESSSAFTASVVAEFEKRIRERLEDPTVRLLIRSDDLMGVSSKGRVLFGRAHFSNLPEDERSLQEQVESTVRDEINNMQNMFVASIDAVKQDDQWYVRAEIVGPKVLSPVQVKAIQDKTSESIGRPVTLHFWSRVEVVVTSDEYVPMKLYSERGTTPTM